MSDANEIFVAGSQLCQQKTNCTECISAGPHCQWCQDKISMPYRCQEIKYEHLLISWASWIELLFCFTVFRKAFMKESLVVLIVRRFVGASLQQAVNSADTLRQPCTICSQSAISYRIAGTTKRVAHTLVCEPTNFSQMTIQSLCSRCMLCKLCVSQRFIAWQDRSL